MFDDTIKDVVQDTYESVPEPTAQEILEMPRSEEAVEVKQEVNRETENEKNIRVLRDARKRAERERDEALRMLQEREAQVTKQPRSSFEDDDIGIAPDELAEGKHLAKMGKKLKKMEEQMGVYHRQAHEAAAEAKIKAQYPDFDSVVNRENLDLLRYAYPELSQTINSATDLYSKAVSAYTLIKKFNIDTAPSQEEDRLKKNMAKPRSVASVSPQQGESPLSRANPFAQGLTEDLKKQLYAEMIEAAKNS